MYASLVTDGPMQKHPPVELGEMDHLTPAHRYGLRDSLVKAFGDEPSPPDQHHLDLMDEDENDGDWSFAGWLLSVYSYQGLGMEMLPMGSHGWLFRSDDREIHVDCMDGRHAVEIFAQWSENNP